MASRCLVFAMAVLILGPPLHQAVLELVRDGSVQAADLFGRRPTAAALRDFEERLENHSWLRRKAQSRYAQVFDRTLARGNRQALIGRDRWLFYRDGVRYIAGPRFDDRPQVDPLDVILDIRRQLAERGVDLVVVPVPVKGTLYPEMLRRSSGAGTLPTNPARAEFIRKLQTAGVPLVDAQAVLAQAKLKGDAVFLERDTHWTPRGMLAVAAAVATRVRELPTFGALQVEAKRFDHRVVRFRSAGDVADMLGYPSRDAFPEEMQFELTQVIATKDGQTPTGDRRSPILVVGDSLTVAFSNADLGLGRRGGFAEHLAEQLGLPLDVVAIPGGGSAAAWRSVARRSTGLHGKRIVIWQFTERDLLFSREGWRRQELPRPEAETPNESMPSGSVQSVLGRVDAVTEVPFEFDYANCLMIVRYSTVQADAGSPVARQFYVAHWGIRDRRRTVAASFPIRQRHAMNLVPLSQRHDLESTCWIDTVGLKGQVWWADSFEVLRD